MIGDVCYTLAKQLRDGDRDTVDESIEEFRDSPIVVAALRRANGWTYVDEEADAVIDYDSGADEWSMTVDGRELGRAPGTPEGHDWLVRRWFAEGEDTPDRRSQMQDFLLNPDVTA